MCERWNQKRETVKKRQVTAAQEATGWLVLRVGGAGQAGSIGVCFC